MLDGTEGKFAIGRRCGGHLESGGTWQAARTAAGRLRPGSGGGRRRGLRSGPGGGRLVVFGLLLGAGLLGLHLQQALPVGDGDLVVVGMDLAEGQEAVAATTVFDEGGLERGLHPDHLGEVDIALELLLGRCLDVEIFEAVTVQHHHAGFFRVCGIDQHAFGH